MNAIKIEILKNLISYDPNTGNLTWLPRSVDFFQDKKLSKEIIHKKWNANNAGRLALNSNCKGYLHGDCLGIKLYAHRVAWAIFYSEWPQNQIDHINGVRTDNRIENLRVVSAAENSKNMKIPKNNNSGVIGVYWDNVLSNWRSKIHVGNKQINLGSFDSFDDAVKARSIAEHRYGFHPNHGRGA